MKYIAQLNKRVNKYYARSISSGKTITTAPESDGGDTPTPTPDPGGDEG